MNQLVPNPGSQERAFAATQTRPENLLRVVREVVADAAADGVVWVQPHFDPHLYPQFGAPQEVMDLVLAEGMEAGARHGVGRPGLPPPHNRAGRRCLRVATIDRRHGDLTDHRQSRIDLKRADERRRSSPRRRRRLYRGAPP
jgi:hypothetical protein